MSEAAPEQTTAPDEVARRAREAWFGWLQDFLEARIEDAPDAFCKSFAQELWDQSAALPDD